MEMDIHKLSRFHSLLGRYGKDSDADVVIQSLMKLACSDKDFIELIDRFTEALEKE